MSDTKSYHITNLGSFTDGLRPDIDGYVHLTTKAVLNGRWDGAGPEWTREQAEEIALENREATESAEAAIADWCTRPDNV